MAVARKFIDKNVLRNVIRHTDAHNKIQEESEMWRVRQLQTRTEERLGSRSPSNERKKKARRYEGRMMADKQLGQTESSYWTKKLYEAEENDSDRWGHSGYKEMYPEEFEDSESDSSLKEDKKEKQRKKKSKRSEEKKRRKKETKGKFSTSRDRINKRTEKDVVSDSETNSDVNDGESKERPRSRKRKRDKYKNRKTTGKRKRKSLEPMDSPEPPISRGTKTSSKRKRTRKVHSKNENDSEEKLNRRKSSKGEKTDQTVDSCSLPPLSSADRSSYSETKRTSSDDRFSRTKSFKSANMSHSLPVTG